MVSPPRYMAKVLVVVPDNAANVVAALRILKEAQGYFTRVCWPYAAVNCKPCSNKCAADQDLHSLTQSRCHVEHFKKSELASTKLKAKQQQMGTPQHSPIQAVSKMKQFIFWTSNIIYDTRNRQLRLSTTWGNL